ncbi:MAG: DUF3122 domain-containing protein [Prochlorococcaceae cyanobacterium]
MRRSRGRAGSPGKRLARGAAFAAGIGLVLLVLLVAPCVGLALESQRWTLQDQNGQPWSLTLLEQADPSYPPGLRLRLTDRSGQHTLDHRRPLQLRDGAGASWELANRSEELVPAGTEALPPGSAQFDLAGLEPRPRAELPLAMGVPLQSGDDAQLVAGAATVAALHGKAVHGETGRS